MPSWFCTNCGRVWEGQKICCGDLPVVELNLTLEEQKTIVLGFANAWSSFVAYAKLFNFYAHPLFLEARMDALKAGGKNAATIMAIFIDKLIKALPKEKKHDTIKPT